jgi:uncharacterized protein YpuA (DUF1002 family)
MNNNFFNDIEKKTGVSMNDVMNLANSLQSANLKDEKTVRQVISQVSQLAGKNISKEKEDQIVKSIVNNDVPMDFSQIAKMINKK